MMTSLQGHCLVGAAFTLIAAAHAQYIPSVALNPIVVGPQSLRMTDVDGDGREDLVFVEATPLRFSWARKAGASQFETHTTLLPAATGATAPRFGDVDGDGDDDLVFANVHRQVLLQRRSATGLLGLPLPLFTVPAEVRDLHLADADGDQDVDLYVSSLGDAVIPALVRVYTNDGQGAFQSGTSVPSSPTSAFQEVWVADLDGDAAAEVVGLTGGRVVVHANDGVGGFSAAQTLDPAPVLAWHAVLADLDNDQDPDLVVSVTGGAPLRVHRNDGTGTFGPAQTRSTSTGLVNQLGVADVNADGWPDIVTTANVGLELFHGLGAGDFAPGVPPTTDPLVRPHQFLLDDIDGDAAPDLVVAILGASATVGWVPNTAATGGAPFGGLVPLSAVGEPYPAVDACDLDGDGRDEFVAGRAGVATPLAILDRQPSGAFQASYLALPGIVGVARVARGRVDLDSLEDLFVQDVVGHVHALRSTAGGGFATPLLAAPLAGGAPFEVGDLDGDGDADVVGAPSPHALAWFENLGALGFSSAQGLLTGTQQVGAIQLADLDGDTDLDIAVARRPDWALPAPARVDWLANLGGTFGAAALVDSSSVDGRSLHAADFDGDARIDLLWDGSLGSILAWAQNLGGGAFASATPLLPFSFPLAHITTLDLELDGDLDVVLVYSDGVVGAWAQDAPGTLVVHSSGLTSSRVGDLVSSDADGDGDRDFILTDRTSAEIEWLESFAVGRIGVGGCGPAVPNSSGASAVIDANGSLLVAANDVRVRASQLPFGSVGFFLASRSFATVFPVPGSEGRLCLGSPIGRFVGPGEVRMAGSERQMVLRVDLTRIPTPTGPQGALVGETWGFQAWFRDVSLGGAATSNFTDAVALTLQ